LTELWFYVPLDTNRRRFHKPISWFDTGKKLNLTQEKHAFTNQKKYAAAAAAEEIYCNTKINAKQLKPGLVAFNM